MIYYLHFTLTSLNYNNKNNTQLEIKKIGPNISYPRFWSTSASLNILFSVHFCLKIFIIKFKKILPLSGVSIIVQHVRLSLAKVAPPILMETRIGLLPPSGPASTVTGIWGVSQNVENGFPDHKHFFL